MMDTEKTAKVQAMFTLAEKMGEERDEAVALAEWISCKRSAAFLRALFEELQLTPSRGPSNAEAQRPAVAGTLPPLVGLSESTKGE